MSNPVEDVGSQERVILMKSLFRGSLAMLVGSVALLVAPVAFAQTQPDESGPHVPVDTTGGLQNGSCSITVPGHSSPATGLPMTLGLIGLGAVFARRRR